MVCIYCASETSVVNSRLQKKANNVWRRRRCNTCNNVFTSIEAPDLLSSLMIKKHSGTLEPFSRDKLFISIYESCKHRANALESATALTNTVLAQILRESSNAVIDATTLAKTTQEILSRYDPAAGVHYGAYHKTT